jgi:hypothetical protein
MDQFEDDEFSSLTPDQFRRLVALLLILLVIAAGTVFFALRAAYYGIHPERRPQSAVSAGSFETCDHDCALRRLHETEERLRTLEGSR